MQRAVTAIYRTHAVADLVREEIADLGISRGHIHVVPDHEETLAEGSRRDTASFNDDLHGLQLPEEDLRTYQEAVHRGNHVVSVNVDDDDTMIDRVLEIMRRPEDSYDLDALDDEYRDAEYVPAAGAAAGTTAQNVEGEQVMQEAEERLRVGKRDVDRGSVHVRAYTREMPVEERVTLRDEHVHVERRPGAERVLTGAEADAAFKDREVVMEEHDEEAVVTKEAVVTGEVAVSKDVETREEVVRDTVRKTEVEVDGDGNPRT